MLVMVVFFIAFRWIHLSTPLIRLFLLVLILLLMPTLNFLPVWLRSYYPSECHADYFDFERIEALKPAIEACGISTLSQSPMLGFHKQMDNRIKLLEEILS